MAVSIQDLIAKKEEIQNKKAEKFDLQTSIGTITVKKPTLAFATEARGLDSGNDEYMIYNMCVEPNLKDASLQNAYGCIEPTDIVDKLFDAGEVSSIANKIMILAGFGKDITAKLHDEAKN